jgi:NAD(P)-dependent dehydrogenase (short-subunit alcohol dehydrogenase family)
VSAVRSESGGRAALVTGASRGIGFAIAEALAGRGFDLTVVARDKDRLDRSAKLLAGSGVDVQAVPYDLSSDSVDPLVTAHRSRFGRLDVLVNNAGFGVAGPIEIQARRHIDLQLQVNLRAMFLMYQACLPMLRESGAETRRSLVVNLASMAARIGLPDLSVYSAAKAGVVAFTSSMNRELHGYGIKSVALSPGFVATEMSAAGDGPPVGEMILPEDLARTVEYLLDLSPNCVIGEIALGRPGADF